MTISILALLYVMFAHWVADFIFQTHAMATKKSESIPWLSFHVIIYTLTMSLGVLPLFLAYNTPGQYWAAWVVVNCAAHWITDYFTSRASAPLFKSGDFHNGFVVVGADQYIHLVCLVLTTAYFLGA